MSLLKSFTEHYPKKYSNLNPTEIARSQFKKRWIYLRYFTPDQLRYILVSNTASTAKAPQVQVSCPTRLLSTWISLMIICLTTKMTELVQCSNQVCTVGLVRYKFMQYFLVFIVLFVLIFNSIYISKLLTSLQCKMGNFGFAEVILESILTKMS